MTEQQEDLYQSKDYQLDEIWQQVLSWVSLGQSFYEVLLRKYGYLQTFDKTSACIRLRLFTGSRRVRVHKGHLKNSVIQAFRLAFSLSFQQPLSQEFQVRFEVENIEDKHSPLQ